MNDAKLKQTILKHPAVETLEFEDENGWWAHLRQGWIDGDAMTHSLLEDTLAEVLGKLKLVRRKTLDDPM